MLEPVPYRWAWSACLVALVLSAVPAAASLDQGTAEQTRDEVSAEADQAGTYLAYTQEQLEGFAVETRDEAEARAGLAPQEPEPEPSEGSGGTGEGNGETPPQGSPGGRPPPSEPKPWVPFAPRPVQPQLPLAKVEKVLAPVRELLPTDPVGVARDAADQARQIPDSILNPATAEPDEAEPQPAGTLAEPRGPSALVAGAVILAAAGAATAATFFGFWLAGSSGAVGTKVAATAASRAGDLRRLLPFASPLFTRFERDTVLGHPRREALYALILQERDPLESTCRHASLSIL